MPESIRIPLWDLAAGCLSELGLMITSYDSTTGQVRLAPRRELECGHPATRLRANVDGSHFCLACRRMESPAARRSRPVAAPAEEE